MIMMSVANCNLEPKTGVSIRSDKQGPELTHNCQRSVGLNYITENGHANGTDADNHACRMICRTFKYVPSQTFTRKSQQHRHRVDMMLGFNRATT